MILKNKIIVITGSSRGFGKALAKAFHVEGATVIVSSRNKDNLELIARELSLDYFVADVTSVQDMNNLAEYVIQKYGRIDIWINNAGIQIAPSQVENIPIEKLKRVFDVNFFGYFYGCQIALAHMKRQNDGVIININSTAGLGGKPDISVYSASKFAIKGLTESIREEVKNSDINILGVFPGGMQTDIYQEKYPDDFEDYMKVDDVAAKIIANLKLDNPEIDFVIKRPKN